MTEPELQYGSVNFLVYLFNSFEQVPVPGVTENRYLAVRRTRGWLSEGRNLVRGGASEFLKIRESGKIIS